MIVNKDEQLYMFDKPLIPVMPKEFIGEQTKPGGITKNAPRKWTEKEIEWCLKLKQDGYTVKEIAESVNRDKTSVSIKIKRLSKTNNTYNEEHIEEKYNLNEAFFKVIRPKTVLDAYCGVKNYWSGMVAECVSNDKNKDINATYHLDAFSLMCQEYAKGNKYDLIDLDPFGSAYDCFDLAIKMANKGLIITYGEIGHLRWKRLDYVRYAYGINSINEFTLENLILHTANIAKHNHKNLIIHSCGQWRGIARVYYIIEPFKNYEAWGENGNV